MKKTYQEPEIKVVALANDVIATSNPDHLPSGQV